MKTIINITSDQEVYHQFHYRLLLSKNLLNTVDMVKIMFEKFKEEVKLQKYSPKSKLHKETRLDQNSHCTTLTSAFAWVEAIHSQSRQVLGVHSI